jgi:hypothetical protein
MAGPDAYLSTMRSIFAHQTDASEPPFERSSVMYDVDSLVRRNRSRSPNGIDPVTDTYEFEPYFRNGQVERVVVIHEPGRGYRTVVHISGRQPIAGDYPEGQWSAAKADLEAALRQHRCDVFTINAPIWTERPKLA